MQAISLGEANKIQFRSDASGMMAEESNVVEFTPRRDQLRIGSSNDRMKIKDRDHAVRLLNERVQIWSSAVRDIREAGRLVMVTVAISTNGITREAVGTGPSGIGSGVKYAEDMAFCRAAGQFLDAAIENATESKELRLPSNPVATNLRDLISATQLEIIRGLALQAGVDADAECDRILACMIDEISTTAAAYLIDHLESLSRPGRNAARMKKAG